MQPAEILRVTIARTGASRFRVAYDPGAMFNLVIDTSVWLDLDTPENEVLFDLLEDVRDDYWQ